MNKGANLSPLAIRRRLGFLATFERKFHSLKREKTKLAEALENLDASPGPPPTGGIERIARSLLGSGAVYGMQGLSVWAKGILERVDAIRSSGKALTTGDIEWLDLQINDLHELHKEATAEAQKLLEPFGGVSSRAPRPSYARVSRPSLDHPSVPSAAPTRASSIPAAPLTEGAHPPMRATVLVAASTASTRKQAVYILSGAGYETFEAEVDSNLLGTIERLAPDLIILDEGEPKDKETSFAKQIAQNPLVDLVPVLVIQKSAEGESRRVLTKPFGPEELVARARELTGPQSEPAPTSQALNQTNLKELVEFVKKEILSGVMDAATGPGISHRFSVDKEGPLVAAIWSLVAQMRRLASQGLGERVDFSPLSHGWIDMMAPANLSSALDASDELIDSKDLRGLKDLEVLVAGEDPELLAVFNKVLSSVGMVVRTARNGDEALRSIRSHPPAVIIADILMPGIDGWELSGRLMKQFGLNHIPVILLSWKEEFLRRLRAQQLKDDTFQFGKNDRLQVLRRVARVMRPRLHLEKQLTENQSVNGRVDRLGTLTVLNMALRAKQDLRVTFQGGGGTFTVDLKENEIIGVTRNGADGSVSEGEPALKRLLSLTKGRFQIGGPVRNATRHFNVPSDELLDAAVRELNHLVGQIVNRGFINIERIEFNSKATGSVTQYVSATSKQALGRLKNGEKPDTILRGLAMSHESMETLLLDLVRLGALTSIESSYVPAAQEEPADGTARTGIASLPPPAPVPSGKRTSLPPPAPSKRGAPATSLPPPLPGTKAKERSAVITLSQEDIQELDIGEGRSAFLPSPRSRFKKGGMAVAAVLLLSFLAFIVVFFMNGGNNNSEAHGNGELPPEETARQIEALPPPTVDTGDGDLEEAEEATLEAPDSPKTSPKAKTTKAPKYKRRPKTQTAAKNKKSSKKTSKKTKKSSKPKEPAAGDLGELYVRAPSNARGLIRVSVDGKLKGRAPLTLTLSSGLHEVIFSYKGKRTIKMVSIKAGEKKRLMARMPK